MSLRPVLLWGPPGSGKSTVAPRLAHALGRPFVDIDAEIVREVGREIPEIFAREGETGFRERERALLLRAMNDHAAVIAVGGGALIERSLRREMLRRALVVVLTASRDVLASRMASQRLDRPLLAGDPAARLEALLRARREAYGEAHVQIVGEAPIETVLALVRVAVERLSRGDVHVVPLGSRSYRVSVGPADQLASEITALSPSRVVWVTDSNVARKVGGHTRFGTSAPDVKVTLAGRGDADKTLTSVRKIWDAALTHGIDRDALVVGAGGGVVTDLAGFAAGTLLRGIRYVSAPTTLLAMVDASVGGKTGFDHRTGKNLLGAFHQPSAVVCDPSVLATLAPRERRAGVAEMAKIALACDPALLEALGRDATSIRTLDPEKLAPHIGPSIQAKIDVVVRDEHEAGDRALLNFGHTIGHAIEQGARYAIPHGECIALGMRAALDLGVRIGLTPPDAAAQAFELLDALALPIAPAVKIRRDVAIRALARDKKTRGGALRFVFCTGAGRAAVQPVDHDAAVAALDRVLEIRVARTRRVRSER